MRVDLFDERGLLIGTAYHENDHGVVMMEPATRPWVATYLRINHGPLIQIEPMYIEEGKEQMIRIRNPRDDSYAQYLRELQTGAANEVDNTATDVAWWRKIVNWLKELLI